mgnify:CR=1 FL=1
MITGFRHERQRQTKRRKLLGILLFFLLLLFFFRTPVASTFSSVFGATARPVFLANSFAKEQLIEWGKMLSFRGSLVAENKRLNEILDVVSLEAYSREALRAENEQLKAAFGRASGRSFLLARVLATPGRSPYDTLILDVGWNEEIAVGMKVFVDGDFVIGEVSKVMKRSAIVTLYSSYGNEFSVTIGTSSIPALAKGMGGGNFRVALSKDVPVFSGDLVHIPAIAPEYAGVVAAISRHEGSSLQDIYFKWPFNVNELTFAYVAVAEEVSTSVQ